MTILFVFVSSMCVEGTPPKVFCLGIAYVGK